MRYEDNMWCMKMIIGYILIVVVVGVGLGIHEGVIWLGPLHGFM